MRTVRSADPSTPRVPVDGRRLFIGFPVDEAVRSACTAAAGAVRARGLAARYVDPARYHVTVAFLGTVPASRIAAVGALVARLARETKAFEIPIERIGGFPTQRRARVVWAGPREPVAPFDVLAARARSALMMVGYRLEPDSVPHVTLARARDTPLAIPADVAFRAVTLRAETLVLFESVADQNGPRYVALAREYLARGSAPEGR